MRSYVLNNSIMPDIGWVDAAIVLECCGDDFIYMKGWACNPENGKHGESVLIVDQFNRPVASAKCGEKRPDVAAALDNEMLYHCGCGWAAKVRLAGLAADAGRLHAYLLSADSGIGYLLNGGYELVFEKGRPRPMLPGGHRMPTSAGHTIIHQVGKVGSTSLYETLLASNTGKEVHQVHIISEQACTAMQRNYRLSPASQIAGAHLDYTLLLAARTRQILADNEPITIVTGFRDPLKHAISACFQLLPILYPDLTYSKEHLPVEAEFVLERFMTCLSLAIRGLSATSYSDAIMLANIIGISNWFENEFPEAHGFSVYEQSIKTSDDVVCFERKHRHYILYRFEALNKNIDKICSALCPGGVNISIANKSDSKSYRDLYACFHDNLRLTQEMQDFFYQSRFYRHFYL